MKALLVLLVSVFIVGCGNKLPTQRSIYRIATTSATELANLPESAKFRPMDNAVFSIAKNAARVDVTYDYEEPGGASESTRLSICLKRVAMTWTFERAYPTPFAQ